MSGRADRAAARRAGRDQGHHRHGGHADGERLACCTPGARRRATRRWWRCCGRPARSIMGKTVTTEFATAPPGQDAQPAQSRAHAGRIVERIGGRGGGGDGAAGARQPDDRLDDPAGVLLRRLRLQAHPRADPAPRDVPALPHARSRRAVRARARRHRAAAGAARRSRRARSRHTSARARARTAAIAAEEPPLPPMFAFVKTPRWKEVDADAQEAFAELVTDLGARVEEVELSVPAEEALRWHEAISGAEMARNLAREWETAGTGCPPALRGPHRARPRGARRRLSARARPPCRSCTRASPSCSSSATTPSSRRPPPGPRPPGSSPPASPTFCTMWTLCGMPALSVPLMQGANGLPLGVQLVGPRHGDARLLRTARWLVAHVERDQ